MPRTKTLAATAPRSFPTINPATGENGRVYQGHTIDQAILIAADVHQAQSDWRRTLFNVRADLMKNAAQAIRKNRERYARLMTDEMGKTVTDGVAELEKCASTCEYFAQHAEEFLRPIPQDMSAGHAGPKPPPRAFVTFNPLGVILAVMPWNFPFWQVIRFAAPHLMAGNAGVLKHASNVPGCALAVEEIFREAGFPTNVFRTVLLSSKDLKPLIEDPHIAAVTLTGSVAAGKSVAATAGAVMKKGVFELGGSDGYTVLEDADPVAAARICARGRMVNGGQSCIAAKRFVVVESAREAFERALVEEMRAYVMGDPYDPKTRLGPMESVHSRDKIASQVRQSVRNGAKNLLGGEVPKQPGAWYPATVLSNVLPGQPAHDEEVFGPVAAVISAKDEADAIRIVNASHFGLGAAVIAGDTARGERIAAEELDAGAVFVNESVRSDPRLAFGGVKDSGYGRELSEFGIREFCNIKSVLIEPL
ncbi:NAD-dependent succinate-semialdehyde dehydrogenase [Bradyrhizobium sp. ISRA443]|uniref:NAD-dependent succinate-semialdehyde dehydrogenase n=1 Tax=unclassified Bradyrhizobium TaxID=2631580 RepID=UPI00247A36FB|nr:MULTISPECIES: NAD-dependent succinate-semialdehyde dehydrogenase [unclassified Bradyrhizobium]WGR93951.1 NAD-dependent succinate-semialdehyde dehydrogenase [Bradyrhizobium sp. ISRA435]WGR98576.1 NAD-dependent succinate-semialdehyde dehydrogenase [Bradyrhizobium sp. ISRA436]WGS05465.1 NAD-dependent succinate-semialdehyde dehydrogenase [Bradyrhizobium sp. ISRA437]WGS12352.1 NAD-dependent succinate-semialdehyde dehydrogenase [Bradyrhizobium sp. ISRA443]